MDIKKTPYWNIYADVFNYFKASMPVQNSDEYWDRVCDEGDKLYEKYKETKEGSFVADQIVDIQKELQRLALNAACN